jgi:endonuclease YncB( thermonuclease family)
VAVDFLSPAKRQLTRILLLAIVGSFCTLHSADAACQGEDGGRGVVTDITGGETLILEDGRAIRLIGILGPRRAKQGPASEARLLMEEALAKLTLGKQVSLQLGERKRDRYGRLLAQVILETAGSEPMWVQAKLVTDGLARVISFQDNRLCVDKLLALEDVSRRKQHGFWKTGFFAVRPAMAEDLLSRLAQSYEIVEGRVAKVEAIKGRTYLNFGRNWRHDFTAFIPGKTMKLFMPSASSPPPKFELAELAGKQVRVRGWLKNYNGPSITISHPEQIELLGEAASKTQ